MYAKKWISLVLCLFTAFTAFMPVNAEESNAQLPEAEVNESATEYYISIFDAENNEEFDYLVGNEPAREIAGMSWNSATRTLTLNGLLKPAYHFMIGSDNSDGQFVNVVLKGENELCYMELREPVRFSGEGTLSTGMIIASDLEMLSGTLNLKSEYLKHLFINYPTDESVGGAINPWYREENSKYSFLGGTVNISGDYDTGIDSYWGDLDVFNCEININIPKYGIYGLSCGVDDEEFGRYGGKLRIRDSRIAIHLSQQDAVLVFCFEYEDMNHNLNYFTGKDTPQKGIAFSEAFVTSDLISSIPGIHRTTVNFPGQNYFLITHEFQFEDVADNSRYFYKPVYWAFNYKPQITVGTSAVKFSPDDKVTRGQMVTFLYRLAGTPEPETDRTFDDVDPGRYYAKAITWAAENGITTGYAGTNNFGPDDFCTREQIVTFLWRYADSQKPVKNADFTDAKAGAYYLDALSWAAEKGITVGLNDGTGRFGVGQTCTRGMCVTFLYRYANQ